MAMRNPMIHQPIMLPANHHPGNMVLVPHPPGVQFGGIRGPVPNSFVPMQVTRQSVHPRAQHAHPPPHPPAGCESLSKKEKKKEMQKPLVEQAPHTSTTAESSCSIASPATTERAQNQERPISSSKPPGSRLAIRFSGP